MTATTNKLADSTTRVLVVCSIALLIAVVAACGSSESADPTVKNTVQPTATFQTIQVTIPTNETPTPVPAAESATSTRGAPRPFPELLKTAENVTTGPLISGWQGYLDTGVMVFENNTWDFCDSGRGVAFGDALNGPTRWTLAPPAESLGLEANEITIGVGSPTEEKGYAGVLSYENDQPVLKPIQSFNQRSTEKVEYVNDPIPFEMYELTSCLNP